MDNAILMVLSEIKYGIITFDEALKEIKQIIEYYKNNPE